MLGSHHFYALMKMITTIYERLVKAKSLLKEQTIANLGDDLFVEERFDMFVSIVLLTMG